MTWASKAALCPAATSAATWPLVDRPGGQHGVADDVADGEDVRHVAAHLGVHGMKPRSVTATPALSAAIFLPLGLRRRLEDHVVAHGFGIRAPRPRT